MPPQWCKDIPEKCNEDSIDVYCGNFTAAERRRRRSPTMQVYLQLGFELVQPGLKPPTFLKCIIKTWSFLS